MKIIAIGAILGCIALNAVPAISSVFPHGPKQINAESFNLVSPKGVLLATLGQGVNGGYLAFSTQRANPRCRWELVLVRLTNLSVWLPSMAMRSSPEPATRVRSGR